MQQNNTITEPQTSDSRSKRGPQPRPRTETTQRHQSQKLGRKTQTEPGPDVIQAYWLKKLTALFEHLAARMSELLATDAHFIWLRRKENPDPEVTPQGYLTFKLLKAKMQSSKGHNVRQLKHQFPVDRLSTPDSMARCTNLRRDWVWYHKA